MHPTWVEIVRSRTMFECEKMPTSLELADPGRKGYRRKRLHSDLSFGLRAAAADRLCGDLQSLIRFVARVPLLPARREFSLSLIELNDSYQIAACVQLVCRRHGHTATDQLRLLCGQRNH